MSPPKDQYNQQYLSKASERIRSNKQVLQRLNNFHESATKPNQAKLKMIQMERSEGQQQSHEDQYETNMSSKLSFLSNHKEDNTKLSSKRQQTQISSHQKPSQRQKIFELERRTPVKQDLGFCGRVLKYFLIGFVIVFLVDFYYEMQNEIQLKTNEISKCYQDYHENNCLDPVEALVQECSRLEFCASRDPRAVLKLSSVFIRTVVGLIGVVTGHLQIAGMVFVVVLVAIYLNRPTMYHEEKVYKYQ